MLIDQIPYVEGLHADTFGFTYDADTHTITSALCVLWTVMTPTITTVTFLRGLLLDASYTTPYDEVKAGVHGEC